MAIDLASTRYLLTTDDLLAGWDQKSWIEGADDRQGPDTTVSSFDELASAAASGGPGSPEETAMTQIMAVISVDAKEAEQFVESFCAGIYVIPFNPVDGIAKTLMLDWMKHRIRSRKDMYRTPEVQQTTEQSLVNRGKMIRTELMRLTSQREDVGSNLNESMAGWGSDERRDSGSSGPFNDPSW